MAFSSQNKDIFRILIQIGQLIDCLQGCGLEKPNQLINRLLVLGILLEEEFVLPQRFGIAIQGPISLGFVVMSPLVLGVGLQLFVEPLDSFFELIQAEVGKPYIEVNLGIPRRSA